MPYTFINAPPSKTLETSTCQGGVRAGDQWTKEDSGWAEEADRGTGRTILKPSNNKEKKNLLTQSAVMISITQKNFTNNNIIMYVEYSTTDK